MQKAKLEYELGLNLQTEKMIIMEAALAKQDTVISDLRSRFELQMLVMEDECAEQRAFDVEVEQVAAEEMESRFAVCVSTYCTDSILSHNALADCSCRKQEAHGQPAGQYVGTGSPEEGAASVKGSCECWFVSF